MIERRRNLAGELFETVTVTSNVSTTLTIWNISTTGTSLTVLVPYGTSYTVSGAAKTNYSKSGGGTYTASLPTRSVSITYSLLYEKVTVTSNVATYITIAGTRSSSRVTSFTKNVAYGTTYTVTGNYEYRYNTPSSQTFTAGLSTRSVTLTYTFAPTLLYAVNDSSSIVRVYFYRYIPSAPNGYQYRYGEYITVYPGGYKSFDITKDFTDYGDTQVEIYLVILSRVSGDGYPEFEESSDLRYSPDVYLSLGEEFSVTIIDG